MIVSFTLVTKLGQVTRYGTIQEELLHTLEVPEESVLLLKDSVYREFGYYDFGLEVFVQIPEKPNEVYQFDYGTKQWVDPRTLQDFKDAQWSLIKQARNVAINADLVTPYGVFDSDEGSRKSITDAVLMLQTLVSMGTPTTIDFTLADNTVVTMSTLQMVEVGVLLGQKTQDAYSRARVKRESIEATTTKEDVLLINWE